MDRVEFEIPQPVADVLPEDAQDLFVEAWNKSFPETKDLAKAWSAAWVAVLAKYEPRDGEKVWKRRPAKSMTFKIAAKDAKQRIVFGWGYQAQTKDGKIVEDHSRKVIPLEELEPAVYKFMEGDRPADEMHERIEDSKGQPIGRVVESCMVTEEKLVRWGLAKDAMPKGWWAGVKVLSDEAWAKVEDGTYEMFSVTGLAEERPVERGS